MNVLMRHWHYLLHQSGLFVPSLLSVPFPHEPCSHSRLSSVFMKRDFGHTVWPLAFAIRASFLYFSADAFRLACRWAITERPKVTLTKTESAFCLSALPSHAVHPPILAVAWLLFYFPLSRRPVNRRHWIGTCKFCLWKTVRPANWADLALTVVLSGHMTYLLGPRRGA